MLVQKKYYNRVFGRNLVNFIALFFAKQTCNEPKIKVLYLPSKLNRNPADDTADNMTIIP